jgi:hypothetical protein
MVRSSALAAISIRHFHFAAIVVKLKRNASTALMRWFALEAANEQRSLVESPILLRARFTSDRWCIA